MKKNARQWGFFAILLAAVLASGQVGATTIFFRLEAARANPGMEDFPLSLPDTARVLTLPEGPPLHRSASFLIDEPRDTHPGVVAFGSLAPTPPTPAGPGSNGPGTATDIRSPRPSLSERELEVWKSNDEPEDWLFRRQFAKTSIYEAPEPSPLIPIPEPTSGLLVLMGIAGRTLWGRYAARRGRRAPST